VLDWRLARRLALDVLLTEHMASDPWDHIRAAAMRGVNRAFSWQVLDARPRPVIDIGIVWSSSCIRLDQLDNHVVGAMPTAYGPAKVLDVFNFDRRPGEVYRRL
jgi:hypothetical protein